IDARGQLPSLTTVLLQEIDRYNNSLSGIHSSLMSLQKAIKGKRFIWKYDRILRGESVNVHGIFVEAAEWRKDDGAGRYDAPLYKTQARSGVLSTTGHSSNFILSILLESSMPPDFWILRGTALGPKGDHNFKILTEEGFETVCCADDDSFEEKRFKPIVQERRGGIEDSTQLG
ncbi:Dynein heavy chain 6, axonemal, partial [Eumeta japonica]